MVEIVPADRATDVLPNTPVTVTASVGKVRTVKVTDDQGKELAGSIDAAGNWTSARFMKPSATYTVEVSAEGPDGTPSTQQAQFTTLKPGVTATYGINYCRHLERTFLRERRGTALTRNLRTFYRLGQADRLAFIAR